MSEQETNQGEVTDDLYRNDLVKELKSGYTVGYKENGDLVFEIHGEDTGLIQLLGLNEYARHRVEFVRDVNQGYGPAGIIKALNGLGSQVAQLAKLVGQSLQKSSNIILP